MLAGTRFVVELPCPTDVFHTPPVSILRSVLPSAAQDDVTTRDAASRYDVAYITGLMTIRCSSRGDVACAKMIDFSSVPRFIKLGGKCYVSRYTVK